MVRRSAYERTSTFQVLGGFRYHKAESRTELSWTRNCAADLSCSVLLHHLPPARRLLLFFFLYLHHRVPLQLLLLLAVRAFGSRSAPRVPVPFSFFVDLAPRDRHSPQVRQSREKGRGQQRGECEKGERDQLYVSKKDLLTTTSSLKKTRRAYCKKAHRPRRYIANQ